MWIVGCYNSEGEWFPYVTPQRAMLFGNQLRDPLDGRVLGVRDEYGEWVSPSMRALGIKYHLEVEE